MKMLFLLLLLPTPQDKVSLPRTQRSTYQKPVQDSLAASKKIESSPREAIEALTTILEDARLKKRECRIRWEIAPGTWGKFYDFFPYQYRGRARIARAKGLSDDEAAQKLLKGAVEDLKESVNRGLSGSRTYLNTAETLLKEINDKLNPDRPDPLPLFKKKLDALILSDRYIEAKQHIETEGKFLSPAERMTFLRKAQDACRDYILGATRRFVDELNDLAGVDDLQSMSRSRVLRQFGLPEQSELITQMLDLDWCRAVRTTLLEINERKMPMDALFDHAVQSIALVQSGRNDYFLGVERLGFEMIGTQIKKSATESRNADAATRKKLRHEADLLEERWTSFADRIQRAAKKLDRKDFMTLVPKRDLEPFFSDFPMKLEGVDKVVSKLERAFHSENPTRALTDAEFEFRKLHEKSASAVVESRKSILTYLVLSISLRRLLDGEDSTRIARDLRDEGRELKDLGGASGGVIKTYGPKVKKIFDELLR